MSTFVYAIWIMRLIVRYRQLLQLLLMMLVIVIIIITIILVLLYYKIAFLLLFFLVPTLPVVLVDMPVTKLPSSGIEMWILNLNAKPVFVTSYRFHLLCLMRHIDSSRSTRRDQNLLTKRIVST